MPLLHQAQWGQVMSGVWFPHDTMLRIEGCPSGSFSRLHAESLVLDHLSCRGLSLLEASSRMNPGCSTNWGIMDNYMSSTGSFIFTLWLGFCSDMLWYCQLRDLMWAGMCLSKSCPICWIYPRWTLIKLWNNLGDNQEKWEEPGLHFKCHSKGS